MKKIFNSILLVITLLFISINNVKAEGVISVNYISKDSITEGSIINVDININNVSASTDGKMYSLGGYIDFDSEYLEFVSFEGKNGFDGLINENNYKIALIDYTLSKGSNSGVIGTITFKTIKSGETTIGFRNASGTDLEKNMEVSFSSKKLNIKSKEIVKEEVKETKKEVKKEVKTTKKETKKEVKTTKTTEKVETNEEVKETIVETITNDFFKYILTNNFFKRIFHII